MYGRLPHDDALLHEMISSEQRFNESLRSRRAKSIERMEPPDILAFYDKEIAHSDFLLSRLKGHRNEESR